MNKIYVYCEDNNQETTWAKLIIKGIESDLNPKKETLCLITNDKLKDLEENNVLVVVGFTNTFIDETLTYCLRKKIRPLLVGSTQNYININNVSCVSINRESSMYDNVLNLINNHASRVAIIGVNPSVQTDLSYLDGYKSALKVANIRINENDIYTNTVGIEDTISNFLKNYKKYDAVVCTNDYVAIILLSKLDQLGIAVPKQLQVTGSGNIDISKFAKPSLTTIEIPLETVGKQACTLYRLLNDDPSFKSLYSSVEHNIIYRDSTSIKKYKKYSIDLGSNVCEPLISKAYETGMKPIWTLSDAFSSMDEVDRKIIHGIINNLTNTETAYEAYVADSTLRYRLKRIYQITNTNGKQELKDLILKYLQSSAF